MSTVALITARGLFGRRRALILLPLPLLLIGLAAICRAYDLPGDQWGEAVIVGLGFAVVLPVVSLIVGTGVLGSEVDDGTLVHILTKPLPRRDIILAKYGVAAGASSAGTAFSTCAAAGWKSTTLLLSTGALMPKIDMINATRPATKEVNEGTTNS